MNELRRFNEYIFSIYVGMDQKEDLACPHLVSSKKMVKKVRKHPVLYIGQETYGWVNWDKKLDDITLDTIEDRYDEFMINGDMPRSPFWRFIKNVADSDYNSLYKDIVWANTLLVGKRYQKGYPALSLELKKISLENLLFLYEYFEPSAVIDVSGKKSPYFEITVEFLEKIGSNLVGGPSVDNLLQADDCKRIMWTYHPNWLLLSGKFNEECEQIKKRVRNKKY